MASADGRRLFFESDRTRSTDIFYCNLEARRVVNVAHRPGNDRFAAPTADGKRVFYRDGDARCFFVLDLETGAKREVPGTQHVWSLETSADGRRIAFVVRRNDDSSLHVRRWEW